MLNKYSNKNFEVSLWITVNICSETISDEPGKRTVHIVRGRGGYPQTRTGTNEKTIHCKLYLK